MKYKRRYKAVIFYPLFALLIFALYGGCLLAFARVMGEDARDVVVFQPHLHYPLLARFLIQPALFASASLIIFLFPAFFFLLPFRARFKNGLEFLLVVFPVNIVILALAVSVYKAVAARPLTRTSFFLITIFLTVLAGLYSQVFKRKRSTAEARPLVEPALWIRLLIGLALVLALLFIFRDKVFLEDFNDDGAETFQLARSLKSHMLPYWDFEIKGKWGTYVVNPALVDSSPCLFLTLLLGESAGAARLLFFIYLWCIYLSFLALVGVREKEEGAITDSAPGFLSILILCLFLVLFALIMSFKAGWHPLFTDILANPYWNLFAFLLNAAIYFLLTKREALFVFFGLLMCLVLYSGPIFLFSMLLFYLVVFKESRRWLLRPAAWLVSLGCLVVLLYLLHGWRSGYLLGWKMVLDREYFSDYLAGGVSLSGNLQFIGKCFIFFGGLPLVLAIILFARFKEKDRISLWLALVAILYLVVIFGKEIKAWHYITPIAAVPLIIFLRMSPLLERKRISRLLAALTMCSLVLIIALLWPWHYSVHTDYRELGKKTCMLFAREEEAVEAARRILHKELFKEGLSEHVWVEYAEVALKPRRSCDYYLTSERKPPLPGLKLLVQVKGKAYLYGRQGKGEEIGK